MTPKIPVSVLVVVHTADLDVLLIERAARPQGAPHPLDLCPNDVDADLFALEPDDIHLEFDIPDRVHVPRA